MIKREERSAQALHTRTLGVVMLLAALPCTALANSEYVLSKTPQQQMHERAVQQQQK